MGLPYIPDAKNQLKGRDTPVEIPEKHAKLGTPLDGPFPRGMASIYFGMGCFWGAERKFWNRRGVHSTAVGYAGGSTPNPTYPEVCSGMAGHAEVVRVVYNPKVVTLEKLLRVFWENHNPTQGMRQGNDTGSQYRSMILLGSEDQRQLVLNSRDAYQAALNQAGIDRKITTSVGNLDAFYFAETVHQQYLYKNPKGYCGLGGTGVSCPRGLGAKMAKYAEEEASVGVAGTDGDVENNGANESGPGDQSRHRSSGTSLSSLKIFQCFRRGEAQ